MTTRTSKSLSRAVRVPADLLRLAVLVAVVVALAGSSLEGGVRLSVVFLVLLVARLRRIPAPFDLAVCLLLPVATVASLLHWYRQLSWLDWVMHGVTTGAVAAMVYLLLAGSPLLPLDAPRPVATVAATTLLGVAVGVVWEFYEWFAEIVLDVRIGVGYTDTIADLAMDTAGSLLAGLALLAWRSRTHGAYRDQIAPERGTGG